MTTAASGSGRPTLGEKVFADFVDSLLSEQEDRKRSLEQRGAAVITSSGVLASLLFALVALVTGADGYVLPTDAEAPLVVALVLFSLAGVGGVASNIPVPYKGVDAKDFLSIVENQWNTYTESEALQMATVTRAKQFSGAKSWNQAKAWAVLVAQALEVLAVGTLALAIFRIFTNS